MQASLEQFQDLPLANGSDIIAAAEALEQEGHFAPAARLFEEARRRFEAGRVGDATFWAAVRRRDECLELARERGENPDVAMHGRWDLIRANPERFVNDYYHGIVGPCVLRLRETAAADDHQALLSLVSRMTPLIGFVTGPMQQEFAFQVCYFAGVAQNRLGCYPEAVANFRRAAAYAAHFRDGLPRNARAGLCYGLGEAEFYTGANPEEALGEAITHYTALSADQAAAPELTAEAVRRRINATIWLVGYYGWRPPRYPMQLEYALSLTEPVLPLLEEAERREELIMLIENLQRCLLNIEPKQRALLAGSAHRIISLAYEWMQRLGDARGAVRLGLAALHAAEALGDHDLVARTAAELVRCPVVQYDPEAPAVCERAARRAEACAAIHEVVKNAGQLAADGRFADAHALAARAQGAADALADVMLWDAIDQLRAELDIRDPARLPRHAKAIREWAHAGEFRQAEERLRLLQAAQPQNPELAQMQQEMTGLKRDYVDTCLREVQGALGSDDLDGAETAMAKAAQLGAEASYQPDGMDAARADISARRARSLAERALECSRRSDHDAARELLDEAHALPQLDEQTRAQLVTVRDAVEKARIDAALLDNDAVGAMLDADNIKDADRVLKTAEERGLSDRFRQIQEQLSRYRQAANRVARARQLIEEHGFEDAVTILEGVIAEDITDGLNKDAAEALNDAHEAWAKADCETGLALLARARRLAHERRYWEAEDTLDEISQLRYGRRLDGHIQDLLRTIGQAQQFIRERYAPATDTSVMVAIGGALMAMLISLFGFGLSTPLCVWISVMSFGLLHGLSGYFRGGSWIAHDGNLHCGALAGACGANLAFVALLAALQVPMLPGWVVTAVLTGIGFAMLEAGMDRACPARVPRRRDTHYTDRQVDEHEHHLEPRYIDNF